MLRPVLISILIFPSWLLFAQFDTLNQTDENGLKQGYWIFYGRQLPERKYCDTCRVEEGRFLDNRKTGEWTMYHQDGVTPRIQGHFVNGRPAGAYKKYYPSGGLMEEGFISLGKMNGVFRRYFESGCIAMEKFYNENGKEDGLYISYYDLCSLGFDNKGQIEVMCQKIDGISCSAQSYYPSGCLRQNVRYGSQGDIVDAAYFLDTCGCEIVLTDSLVNGYKDQFPAHYTGRKFDPNGFNKVYNEYNLLWMEGDFKEGKLWDGKIYKYTDSGNLYRTELWKAGEFFEVFPVTDWEYKNFENSLQSVAHIKWDQIDSFDIQMGADGQIGGKSQSGPSALGGYMRADDTYFDANGDNYVFNVNGELWLTGRFKNGHLWNGTQYFYDEAGNELFHERYYFGLKCGVRDPNKRHYR